MSFLKKVKVADFFLNEAHPYSKKRSIKVGQVVVAFAFLAGLVLLLGSYFESKARHEHEVEQAAKEAQANSTPKGGTPNQQSPQDDGYVSVHSGGSGFRGGGARGRQLGASQIIKRGEYSGDALPIGSQVHVRLIGQVESMDSNSPVTAVVVEDATSPGQTIVIPKGTKVIGNGQLDSQRERLQVRFSTLVFPEGEQFGLSGIATMPDGSSGLSGNFSSGMFRRHASQFIGSFVGGLAEGMKDRSSVGQLGIPFEPGGLKNGALNGVAQSSLDYAKSSSEQMGQSSASITVPNGKDFILYLEREFHQ